MRMRTLDPSPCQILYKKSDNGICPLWVNLYLSIINLDDFELLKPHFYTYNFEIWLKRTDIRIYKRQRV